MSGGGQHVDAYPFGRPAAPALTLDEARTLRAIADRFALAGTAPVIDWSRPAVFLTHPLQRTSVIQYDRGADLGRFVSLTRPMWIATCHAEAVMLGVALRGVDAYYATQFRIEQDDEDRWSVVALQRGEYGIDIYDVSDVTQLQWWLEFAARRALAQLAGAVAAGAGAAETAAAAALEAPFGSARFKY